MDKEADIFHFTVLHSRTGDKVYQKAGKIQPKHPAKNKKEVRDFRDVHK
jgi:hypothetical protein